MAERSKKTLVIGVAGGTGSGKTTVCDALAGELTGLAVEIIHCDHYYRSVKPRTVAPFTGVRYDDYNIPEAIDFDQLLSDIDAAAASGDWDVILVEGLFILTVEVLRERLDLKIFLDVPADERMYRRIRRNMQRGMKLEEVADYYLDSVRYRHDEYVEPSRWYADVVLNGGSLPVLGLELAAGWVRRRIGEGE